MPYDERYACQHAHIQLSLLDRILAWVTEWKSAGVQFAIVAFTNDDMVIEEAGCIGQKAGMGMIWISAGRKQGLLDQLYSLRGHIERFIIVGDPLGDLTDLLQQAGGIILAVEKSIMADVYFVANWSS